MVSSTRSADVIVIGAGVIGLSTALALRRAGLRVSVVDRQAVGRGGASWAGGGILAPLEPDAVDAVTLPILRDSLRDYADWCAALHESSGVDPEYLRCGMRVLPPFDVAGWKALGARCGLGVDEAPTALTLPGVAQVRSPRLLRALALAARAQGVQLIENEAVLALLGESQVEGVRTAERSLTAGVVVLAAGAWSSGLCAEAQIEPVRGQMLLIDARPGELEGIRLGQGSYLIPRRDGGVVAGSTLEQVGFEDAPSAEGRVQILAAVEALAPELAGRAVLAHWSGLRPAPQRGSVRVEWAASRPGLFIHSGHYRLGITLAPGSALRATQQILSARG